MRSIIKFFFFTFLLSWACFWTAILFAKRNADGGSLQQALVFIGTISPALIAVLVLRQEGRIKELHVIANNLIKWRVGIQWYLFAIGYMVVIKLTVAVLYLLLSGSWPRFGSEPWYILATATIISTIFQAGEEVGWRGFALPGMTNRMKLGAATLVLGVVWSLWHLPLFFLPGADKFGQSFILYTIQIVMLSVAAGWLYWKTNGSLFLVMLMHAAVNNTKDIVPSATPFASHIFGLSASLTGWLTVALMSVIATILLFQMWSIRMIQTDSAV